MTYVSLSTQLLPLHTYRIAMMRPLILHCALIIALTLYPGVFMHSSSTSAIICAATTGDGDQGAVTEVPHRSLWELSVVWDKVGHFVARLISGYISPNDDCLKGKIQGSSDALKEATPLAGNESMTVQNPSRNDSVPMRTHRLENRELGLIKEESDMEQIKRALKWMQISRAKDVINHERVWATLNEDKHDMETANVVTSSQQEESDDLQNTRQTFQNSQRPVLVGDLVEHYSSTSTVMQDIPDSTGEKQYAQDTHKILQSSDETPKPSEQPTTKEQDSTGNVDDSSSILTTAEGHTSAHGNQIQGDEDSEKSVFGKASTPPDGIHSNVRRLFIHPEEDKFRAGPKSEADASNNFGSPYYGKDGELWSKVHHRSDALTGFPLQSHDIDHGQRIHGHHRHLRQQANPDMTEMELAEVRDEAREELLQALRHASKKTQTQRSDASVKVNLESVLNALAVDRPAVARLTTDLNGEKKLDRKIDVKKEQILLPGTKYQPEVENPVPLGRRSLRGLQQAGIGTGAGVGAALAGSLTEAQKAEMRQIFYDAALAMVRELARQALNAEQGGNPSTNALRLGSEKGAGTNAVSQDAYANAFNAMINAIGSKEAKNVNDAIASHSGGPGGVEKRGGKRDISKGADGKASVTKKSLLEVAREVARHNSPSAARPPAPSAYRPKGPRTLRGLKNASIRIPVPFTRDPSSNDSSPTFIYNGSDAVFVPLRQVDPSAQDEAFSRIRPLGPIIQGASGALGGEAITKLGEHQQVKSLSGGLGDVKGNEKFVADADWAAMVLSMLTEHQGKEDMDQDSGERFLVGLETSSLPAMGPLHPLADVSDHTMTAGDTGSRMSTGADPTIDDAVGMATKNDFTPKLESRTGLLQHPSTPSFRANSGPHSHKLGIATPADGLGKVISRMTGPLEVGNMDHEERKGDENKAQSEDRSDLSRTQKGGLDDKFYERATSQLMSHSARNFQKMQDAVNSIMAQEGVMTWEDGINDFND